MSEHEPVYLVLNEGEDFKLDAHVDATGQQRIIAEGYLVRRRPDGVYQTPLIPQLFFGANGQQLQTWSQYLTAGDHTFLRRDSGNPRVPDHDLFWMKVEANRQAPAFPTPAPTRVVATVDYTLPVFLLIGVPVALYAIYKLWWHK